MYEFTKHKCGHCGRKNFEGTIFYTLPVKIHYGEIVYDITKLTIEDFEFTCKCGTSVKQKKKRSISENSKKNLKNYGDKE